MRIMRRFLVVPALLVGSLATAASSTLSSGPSVHLGTGTNGGTCKSEIRKGWQRKVVCRDGDNIAIAVRGEGCLRSEGAAFCVMDGNGFTLQMPGIHLLCASGSSYFLSAGPDTNPKCRRRGDRMTCVDQAGASASADCGNGCGNTKAGGMCCMSGTEGCPPVVEPKKPAS